MENSEEATDPNPIQLSYHRFIICHNKLLSLDFNNASEATIIESRGSLNIKETFCLFNQSQ